MLNFYEQYNISHGIFLTYKNNLSKRLLHTSHKKKTMDRYVDIFPWKKYETFTKENFVLTNLYICFTYNPTNFYDVIEYLRNFDKKDLKRFKLDIYNYEFYFKEDLNYLIQKYNKPNIDNIMQEFINKKIKFYTVWFFIKFTKIKLNKRMYNQIYSKIRFLMLFITFKQEVIDNIHKLLDQLEL